MKSGRQISIILLLAIAILSGIISCSTRPRNVLSEKKMTAVFEDLYLVDAMIRNRRDDFNKDEYRKALMEGLLQKHKITQAELDSSLMWYVDNVQLYVQIQDSASAALERRKSQFDQKMASLYKFQISGFSADLPRFFVLDNNTPIFSFRIDSNMIESFDTEKFKFNFITEGIDTTKSRVESKLYFRYQDSVIVEHRDILSDAYYEFMMPDISDSLLYEISGYVRMRPVDGKTSSIWLNNIANQIVDGGNVQEPKTINDISAPLDTFRRANIW